MQSDVVKTQKALLGALTSCMGIGTGGGSQGVFKKQLCMNLLGTFTGNV